MAKSVVWVPQDENVEPKYRICVSTCVWREFDAATAIAMSKLTQYSQIDPSVQIAWSIGAGDSLISRSRSEQATKFLMSPHMGDVLVFIDSDIVFKPEQVVKLAKQCTPDAYPIICAPYVTRGNDMPRLAQRVLPGSNITVGKDYDAPIEIRYPSTGFIAIHRKVLEAVADTMPICHSGRTSEMFPLFLPMVYDHNDGAGPEYLSEDWAFAARARELGYNSYMDASIILGHNGIRTYYANDIRTNPMGTSYVMVTEGAIDRTDLVGDLADQQNVGPMEIMEVIQGYNATGELQEALDGVDDIEDVYNKHPAWIIACAQYGLSPIFWEEAKVAFSGSGRTLDIASPLGSGAIYSVRNGRPSQYFAWPQATKEFVEKRIARRPGLRLNITDDVDKIVEIDQVYALGSLSMMPEAKVEEVVAAAAHKLVPSGSLFFIPAPEPMPIITSTERIHEILDKYLTNLGGVRWVKKA